MALGIVSKVLRPFCRQVRTSCYSNSESSRATRKAHITNSSRLNRSLSRRGRLPPNPRSQKRS